MPSSLCVRVCYMQHRVPSLNSGMSIFVLGCGGFDRDSDILIGPHYAARKKCLLHDFVAVRGRKSTDSYNVTL